MIRTRVGWAAFALSLVLSSTAVLAQSVTATGTVRKVDESAGKVVIKHGPIKALNMEEPMTMVYRVKDPAALKSVKPGESVVFEAKRENGAIVITKIRHK